MRIAVTGATGLVGRALAAHLAGKGYTVTPVTRRAGSPGAIPWDPATGKMEAKALEGYDAVVHLAGENIATGRWTAAKKQRIRDSRVDGTHFLASTLGGLEHPPRVLLAASAIGYYGDRGDELLDETSPAGRGFLAEVCREWEAACQPARQAGIRVASLRLGVVLTPAGGALRAMLTPFRFGLGGRVGSGFQYWSWIALDDVLGAVEHCLHTQALDGPVNVVAPKPVTNLEFTRVLAAVLHRPALFPLPAGIARLAMGEMAEHLLLASARVAPRRLLETGYAFRYVELEPALRDILRR